MSTRLATQTDYGAAPLDLGITKTLAGFLARLEFDQLSEAARHQARRGIIDWAGCALAGASHPTIAKVLGVMRSLNDAPRANVIAHNLKIGVVEAATVNGQMGHLLDYDDTHMGGVVLHASSPILSALFALAQARGGISGRDLTVAYAAGFEAGVRAGQAAPGHHDGGWHLTGTLGSIAAGAACARLLRLDEKQMVHALGIAATQAAGMQQNRGTMCKSFHAGKAAANGVLAALLAEQGFDSSDEIIEGKRGFCRIYSNIAAPEKVTDELGVRFEIARNGYKPYACGVVLHPAIDAVIKLRDLVTVDPGSVSSLRVAVHPLAVRITGVKEPTTGLQSKFSIYHSAAVAFVDGNAGIPQYTTEKALDPAIKALRGRVEVVADESLRNDEARAFLQMEDGRSFDSHVPHASGTVDNPMSDEAILAKFTANATPVIGAEKAARFAELCWKLDSLEDATMLADALA
ncbi:MAG: MmgE/PrpD family protein [Beijerinckiaceae bacterium]|nr:MmgE/PrpD family protein [Beijerinckiaceae bacterium]